MKKYHILTVNPGSTSTKIGVFQNEKNLFEINVSHSPKQLEQFANIWEQYTFRKEEIISAIEKHGFDLAKLDAVVGRGGLIKPIPSGTYYIDQEMINDARIGYQGQHASNLGCVIAYSIGWEHSIPSFIVDPPAVDDLEPLARISGHADFERSSLLHALNVFATAREHAQSVKKNLQDINLIVAHLGGGVTVTALKQGKAVNVNHGLYEGPFSPERSGSLPLLKFLSAALSEKYTENELKKIVVGRGGLVSYFNTNDARKVEELVKAGSEKHALVFQAMAYQIAEEIGRRATNLKGKIDGIILTGGLAHSKILVGWIKERVDFLSKVYVYPGESELEALAQGGLRVLRGEERAKNYTQKIKKIGVLYQDNQHTSKVINFMEQGLKNAGYVFRKERDNNLKIVYAHCKQNETELTNALEKFKTESFDLIVALGAGAGVQASEYLKNDKIPVVYSGVYNSAIIPDFEKGHANNAYAICYAADIKEQFEHTILQVEKDVKKIGIVFGRGETESEVQYDKIVEHANTLSIKTVGYEVQEEEDFVKAKQFFMKEKVKWVFITNSSAVLNAGNEKLSIINDNFNTVCLSEETVLNGALFGYVVPQDTIAEITLKTTLDILEKKAGNLNVIKPDTAKLVINKKTAEKRSLSETLRKIKS